MGLGGFLFLPRGVFTAPQPRPGRPRVSWGRPAGGLGTGSAGWAEAGWRGPTTSGLRAGEAGQDTPTPEKSTLPKNLRAHVSPATRVTSHTPQGWEGSTAQGVHTAQPLSHRPGLDRDASPHQTQQRPFPHLTRWGGPPKAPEPPGGAGQQEQARRLRAPGHGEGGCRGQPERGSHREHGGGGHSAGSGSRQPRPQVSLTWAVGPGSAAKL